MIRRLRDIARFLFRRSDFEDTLDQELRTSFEMYVDRYVAEGMTTEQARRAARIEFEGLEQVKERVRDGMAGSALQGLLQDLRYGWRGLRRSPSFASIALLTLALGIGVNTAIFSIFYGVLLHPLPYWEPDRLVRIWAPFRQARAPLSGPMIGEIERRNRVFSSVSGIWVIEPRTFTGDRPEQLKSVRVTSNFFDVLGVHAALGRTFSAQDRGTRAIVLSDGAFRRRFAGDPELVGKSVPTADGSATVIGVLPRGFELQFATDANIPSDLEVYDTFGTNLDRMSGRFLRLAARLKPGITLDQAQRDLDRLGPEMRTAMALQDTSFTLKLAGMQADAFADVAPALRALFAGAGFVLLICCVNVSSLLLSRAADRRKEIVLRLSLGASRGRILRQLFAEGLLLCTIGGAAGLAVGWAVLRGLLSIRPERLARIADTGLSWPALAFAAGTALAAAILFAFVPAIESFQADLIVTLRTTGRGWVSRFQRRAGAVLVIGEISLGFVLVTAAVLTGKTLARIGEAHPGFDPNRVLTFQIPVGYDERDRRATMEWEAELASIPGVERVGAISHLPLDQDLPNWYGPFRPQGMNPARAANYVADFRAITPGYFQAMGVRLLEGRTFDGQDRIDGPPTIIIDEVAARSEWPGESPLGRTIEVQGETRTIVGVVEHIHNHSLTSDVRGVMYVPVLQHPRSPLTFVLLTGVDPMALVPAIRGKLRQRRPDAAIAKVLPMRAYVERAKAPAGFTARLAAMFGLIALILAATGIYGVLNYQIARRLPEMGIRMALGARERDVMRIVLGEGLILAALGVVLGTMGALAAARWLGALLYGVSAHDPASFALAVVLLPAAALLGCWRPARRAAAADPAESIREY